MAADDLDMLLHVVQNRMVSVRNAMAGEATLADVEQRRRFRRLRITYQLEMVTAARDAYHLAGRSPRAPLPPEAVGDLEEQHGFRRGTYSDAVRRPTGAADVLWEQNLELAISVTEAELAAPDGPVNRDFVAAVFRICCATVIGALVGAPLGALAAHEDILVKTAEAAVMVGLGATTAEVIEPLSTCPPRAHGSPRRLPPHSGQTQAQPDPRYGLLTSGDDRPPPEVRLGGRHVPRPRDEPLDEP